MIIRTAALIFMTVLLFDLNQFNCFTKPADKLAKKIIAEYPSE